MEQVPNTFSGLFWGYSAIFVLFGIYVLRLGKLIKGLEIKVTELENSKTEK
jgi:hypothetical protein